MSERYTFRSKGQGTLFFIFVTAIAMIFMFGIIYVIGRFAITDMQSLLFIKMETNDEGRELASFLDAGKSDVQYMEILGSLLASEGTYLESELESIKNTIESMGKDCALIYKGDETEPVKKIGRCPEGKKPSASSESVIPIPGKSDSETGRVRLYEYE